MPQLVAEVLVCKRSTTQLLRLLETIEKIGQPLSEVDFYNLIFAMGRYDPVEGQTIMRVMASLPHQSARTASPMANAVATR